MRYVNDSQGTQPDAVIAARAQLPEAPGAHRRRPVDKGVAMDALAPVVAERVVGGGAHR